MTPERPGTAAEQEAELRARHSRLTIKGIPFRYIAGPRAGESGVHPDHDECAWDEADWPCDTLRLLDTLTALRAERDRLTAALAAHEPQIDGHDGDYYLTCLCGEWSQMFAPHSTWADHFTRCLTPASGSEG